MALNLTGNDIIDTSIIRNLTQAASNGSGVKDFKLEDDTIKLTTTDDEFSVKLPSASNALTNDDIGTKVAPLVNGVVPSDKLPSNILTTNDIGTAATKNYTSSISNNSTDLPTAEAVYSFINSLGIENIITQIGNINTNIDNIEQQLSNIFTAEQKVTDFNTTTNSGIYYWIDDAANKPGTNYGVLLVNKYSSGGSICINQIAYGTNGKIYFRQNINSGKWTEWKAVAFDGEINADTIDNYHASQLWRSDGATWNPKANVSLGAKANGDEWSFDISRNGHTGCYWHVLDSVHGSLLKVNADDGKVSAPKGFVGNLSGKADTAGTADRAIGIEYTGENNSCISAQQTASSFNGTPDGEWASYIICNHFNGTTYYHQMLRLPFFNDGIQLQRRVNGELKGWKNVAIIENENTWSGKQTFSTAKASNKMVIPTSAPSTKENGCIWIG